MKIAICETTMTDAKKIAEVIRQIYKEDNVICFANLFSLVAYVNEERKGDVDLVILPTDIGGEDGIEAAHSIQEFYPGIQIILLSDLTARIQEVFRIRVLYLLLRPIGRIYLENAIQYAHEQFEKDILNNIALKFKGNLFRINISSIDYVESVGRRLYIYTSDNKWEINMKMEDICKLLPGNFVLSHRSYLVNINRIMKIDCHDIELFNHMHVPVAKNRFSEICKMLYER